MFLDSAVEIIVKLQDICEVNAPGHCKAKEKAAYNEK